MPVSLRTARRLAVAAVGALTLGCDLVTGPQNGEFRGIYVTGFEASSFRACGRQDRWWLSGNLQPIHDIMPPPEPPTYTQAAYVRVRGTRSGPGQYGHAGGWRYELVVKDVLDASADTLGRCE